MQDDFEKNISQKMQEFSISPQPEIWQRVEAALPPEKKRRFIFWWWLLPIAACLGTGIWLVTHYTPQPAIQPANTTHASKESPVQTADTLLQKSFAGTPAADTGANDISEPGIGTAVKNKKNPPQAAQTPNSIAATPSFGVEKKLPHLPLSGTGNNKNNRKNTHTKTGTIGTENFIPFNNTRTVEKDLLPKEKENYGHLDIAENKIMAPGTLLISGTAKEDSNTVFAVQKKDSTSGLSPTTAQQPDTLKNTTANRIADTATKTDTTAPSFASKKRVTAKPPRTQWIAEAGFGISRLANKHNTAGMVYAGIPNSASSGGGMAGNARVLEQPGSGFGFSAGVGRRQSFTAHFDWQLSLQYALLTSVQAVGRFDSTLWLQDSQLRARYLSGTNNTYSSRTHLLQLLPAIGYTVNPASRWPVRIYAGPSVAYTISSNQLLHDYRTRTYIRSSAYTSKWLWGATIGAEVLVHKKIYAGVRYSQSFTNIATPALQSNFKWRQWQLHAGIPLFNQPKK